MQVKKTGNEATRKPIIPSASHDYFTENLTVRTQSKTKVSTGSRRNNIIGYVPRASRPEVVAPPLTTNYKLQNDSLTATINNGQSLLPSIPLIDDDVVPCFTGGLPILDIQNSKDKLNSNCMVTENKLLKPSFSPSYESGRSTKVRISTFSPSSLPKKEKLNVTDEISRSKKKDRKSVTQCYNISSIRSNKKEKNSNQQKSFVNSGLPNLLDDEFGFGHELLSESSNDEAEVESCKPPISLNEFGLPILNDNNGVNNILNNSKTNYKNNSFELASSNSKIRMNGNDNNQNNLLQFKSTNNSREKNLIKLQNSYSSYNNHNNTNNSSSNNNNINNKINKTSSKKISKSNNKHNNNINNNKNNNNTNAKHEPVITNESNFRYDLNFNKETVTALKRHSSRSPEKDQESQIKKKKKDNSNFIVNKSDINISKLRKDKKNKINKLEKNNESSSILIKDYSSSPLNSHKKNIEKIEQLTECSNNKKQELNPESLGTKFSNFNNHNEFIEISHKPPSNNMKNSNFSNSFSSVQSNSDFHGLPSLTILIDDDDSNQFNGERVQDKLSKSAIIKPFNEFGELPDLSCAIGNEGTNQEVNTKISFSVHEKKLHDTNRKPKGVTKERYGTNKHFDIFSSSSATPSEIRKEPSKVVDSQQHKQDIKSHEYYPTKLLQSEQQNYIEEYSTVFNIKNSNCLETKNYNNQNLKLNEKNHKHFDLKSANYNHSVKTNRDDYIAIESIKPDDHLNSRGTSESEIGILSSSDSSSSNKDSSSSNSDDSDDDECQKKYSNKNRQLYQNTTNLEQHQSQNQHGVNQSSYYNKNYNYQHQHNGNRFNNPNYDAFLHNDLKLSESDSSDSEL